MTTHAHITSGTTPRRVRLRLMSGFRRRPAPLTTAELRARLEAIAAEAIDAAGQAIALLDELDARHADMEPDVEGEAEPDEATAQPATLAPDWVRPVPGRAPTISEQFAKYHRVTGQAVGGAAATVVHFPRRLRFLEVTA